MLLHHVSHYHSMAFGCYKNPYLSLFNLNCGFSLIESLISCYWLCKAPCCAEGMGATAQPISTPGFEMIKRVSYLLQEWEVRGWMMSEMQTHSHLNTAWDGENERQRGTWMREEASHHGVGWNRVEDRRQRAWGKCLWEEKKDDYLRNFCETEALAPSTCLDIVLTTMPPPKAIMTRFMSCTCLVMYLDFKNLPAALFVRWYKALLAIQKRNHTETRWDGHNETPAQCASIQSNGLAVNAVLCEVDIVQPLEVNQPFTWTACNIYNVGRIILECLCCAWAACLSGDEPRQLQGFPQKNV